MKNRDKKDFFGALIVKRASQRLVEHNQKKISYSYSDGKKTQTDVFFLLYVFGTCHHHLGVSILFGGRTNKRLRREIHCRRDNKVRITLTR